LPYVVKWRETLTGPILQSPDAYAVPSAAIDYVCANLRQLPNDIWIEGPNGLRIERAVILRGCEDRLPPGRLPKRAKRQV